MLACCMTCEFVHGSCMHVVEGYMPLWPIIGKANEGEGRDSESWFHHFALALITLEW